MATSTIKEGTKLLFDSFSLEQTVNGNSAKDFDFDVAKTGYTTLGIIGVSKTGSAATVISAFTILNSGFARVNVRNTASSSGTATIGVRILYLKN